MKTRLFILCLFIISGFIPQLDAQVESIKSGVNEYKDSWGHYYSRYFVGNTDEHFYYITSPYKKNILSKFTYDQKEVYSKKINLKFGEKKLGIYSFINSNGKTYAILRNNHFMMKPNMEFFISEFKNDEFGEITQPYNAEEFIDYETSTKYYSQPDHYVIQNENDLYHHQSTNGEYLVILGKKGFPNSTEKKLAVVVLSKNMEIIWQKTINLKNNNFTKVPKFHVANNGDVFVILSEKIKLVDGYAAKQDNKLMHITKETNNFISLGLGKIDIVPDLGFFSNDHGNEINLVGVFERPDEASIGKYHAFEGLFFFKYNIETKEKYSKQNNIPIPTHMSIDQLFKTQKNEYFIKMRRNTVPEVFSENIQLFKLNEKGEKILEKKIYHKFKWHYSVESIYTLMSIYNDKIYIVYSDNIEKDIIMRSNAKYTLARCATLDMNLELIGDKQLIFKTKDTKYFIAANFSFSHEDKIVLCNTKGGNKMKFTTLFLK